MSHNAVKNIKSADTDLKRYILPLIFGPTLSVLGSIYKIQGNDALKAVLKPLLFAAFVRIAQPGRDYPPPLSNKLAA